MRKIYVLLLFLVAGAWSCGSSQPPPSDGDADAAAKPSKSLYKRQELGEFLQDTDPNRNTNQYLIGVGDRLDVVFFYHDELTTLDLLVRPDGRITLPYVGDIMAAGHSPMNLDSTLTGHFEEILRDPNLSIIVRSTSLPRVYVLGEVEQPGHFDIPVDITVLQAISRAGGHTAGAKLGSVLVIRRERVDRVVAVVVDVGAIMAGAAIQNDFQLSNNDVVYVPKTRIRATADFMQELDDIVRPPLEWIVRGLQISVLRDEFFFIGGSN